MVHDWWPLFIPGTVIIAGWGFTARAIYRLSHALSALAQRVSYLEGQLSNRGATDDDKR